MSDKYVYKRQLLTGGASNALDNIDGAALYGGEIAFVHTGAKELFVYQLNASSGQTEGVPLIISPDNNAGLKRWELLSVIMPGARLYDTDNSNVLFLQSGENLTGDRILSLITGNASRTLTMTGNASIVGTNTGDETTDRIGALINTAQAKSTPVDADMVGLMDSASSNVLRKWSWANIKSSIKTYADTLYATTAQGVTSGNSHAHTGGAGAQIGHGSLSGLANDDHTQYLRRAMAIFTGATELTIANGIITASQAVHTVDTEGDAATDDLDTIGGAASSGHQLLLIRADHASRKVVIKNGTGNILTGGSDIELDATNKFIILAYDNILAKWLVAGGSGASMNYPAAGVPVSTGSAWDTSRAIGTAANNIVALDSNAKLPAVNGSQITGVEVTSPNVSVAEQEVVGRLTGGSIKGLSVAELRGLVGALLTVEGDTAPKLGGDLDLNGKQIINHGADHWTIIPTANYVATPASTSTITMNANMTAAIQAGMSLRYIIGGTVRYGRVGAITANLLTVHGISLSGNVTSLAYGGGTIRQAARLIPAKYEDANDTALIANDLRDQFVWSLQPSFLVCYQMRSRLCDTHGTKGSASIRINNVELNTTAGGLTIAANATWYSTVVNISPSVYQVNPGDVIEITAVRGGNGDAEDLSCVMIFVTP